MLKGRAYKKVSISAVVTRKSGEVEDLGVICEYRAPLSLGQRVLRGIGRLGKRLKGVESNG